MCVFFLLHFVQFTWMKLMPVVPASTDAEFLLWNECMLWCESPVCCYSRWYTPVWCTVHMWCRVVSTQNILYLRILFVLFFLFLSISSFFCDINTHSRTHTHKRLFQKINIERWIKRMTSQWSEIQQQMVDSRYYHDYHYVFFIFECVFAHVISIQLYFVSRGMLLSYAKWWDKIAKESALNVIRQNEAEATARISYYRNLFNVSE